MPDTPHDAGTTDPEAERLQEEALGWLRRLTSGEMTDADVGALDRWRATSRAHRRAFAEANLLWDTLAPVARTANLVARRPHSMTRRALFGGAAAAAAAGAGVYLAVRPPLDLWPTPSELMADYRTATGERRQIPAHAGATIEMNTRTSLSASTVDQAVTTLELVSGQIGITLDQRAARPLLVVASGGQTRASQARFDIRRNEMSVCVTCSDGSVEVSMASAAVRLRAGQQVVYGGHGLAAVTDVDAAIETAWQRGLLIFRDAPLERVIDEVNRYRPGRIVLLNSALAGRQVVAGFRIDRIDEAVSYITRVFGARARSLPGGVVLLT